MTFAQTSHCEYASGAIGVEHHRHLACRGRLTPKLDELLLRLGRRIFGQRSHAHTLAELDGFEQALTEKGTTVVPVH